MDKLKEIYLTDTGRFNRLKYFKYLMLIAIVQAIAIGVSDAIFSDGYDSLTPSGGSFLNLIAAALLIPNYFIDVKRLQDFGQDSFLAKVSVALSVYSLFFIEDLYELWGLFDYLVVIVNNIYALYILFKPGDVGENQYGPDPLQ